MDHVCIVVVGYSFENGEEQHEGATDAVCGGEQHIASGTVPAHVWRVREEGAVAGEEVVHAQVRRLVTEVATPEKDEAAAGRHGNVLTEEVTGEARHVRRHMAVQKRHGGGGGRG